MVDKALPGFVLNGVGFSVGIDLHIVGFLVRNKALRCGFLPNQYAAVLQILHPVNAGRGLLHGAEQYIVLVQRLVPVNITVDLECRAAEFILGIVCVILCQCDAAADKFVRNLDLNDLSLLLDRCREQLFAQNEALGLLDLAHEPVAGRDLFEAESAILGGYGCQQCGILRESRFRCSKQTHDCTGEWLIVCINLQTRNGAVDQLILNGCALVGNQLDKLLVLPGVVKRHRILRIAKLVMAVGRDLLQVEVSKGEIRLARRFSVFIQGHHLDQTILRDAAAIGCHKLLRSIKAECNVRELVSLAKAEQLIRFHGFYQTDLHTLAFIVHICPKLGDRDLLSGIYQLNRMRFGLKRHAVRSLLLGDHILAKVECLAGGHAVRLRGDGVYDVSGLCTQGSVRGVNILRGSDIKDCSRKSGILIYRPEDGSLVYNAAEDLAGLLDTDDAFLRHVGLCNCHDSLRPIHGKRNRGGIQHIAMAGCHLDQLIAAVGQLAGEHKRAIVCGIECGDGHWRRIIDGL